MASELEIKELVETISLPGLGLTTSQLNLVQGVEISDKTAKITLASSGLSEARQAWLRNRVNEQVGKLTGIEKTDVEFKEFNSGTLNGTEYALAFAFETDVGGLLREAVDVAPVVEPVRVAVDRHREAVGAGLALVLATQEERCLAVAGTEIGVTVFGDEDEPAGHIGLLKRLR